MAKAPRIGRVKTRLAKGIGSVPAWAFYRRTLSAVSRPLISDPRWKSWMAVYPDETATNPHIWPVQCPRFGQGGGDLGQRMGRVMDTMPIGPVVIIGADIPDIRAHHISAAFTALGNHDAVFGPADDGGYWLVGLKRRPGVLSLFENVRWSTEHALSDTLDNLPSFTNVAYLETLTDVDDASDLMKR
jgi:rSAM/selenodomain-associated transferase 1